ncbi:hypothetical protein IL306_012553 [Fusarium sp. DS 682]|nr:hypothetical protein IL306_012553 [Fusarium sp. DS 682]
MSLLCKARTGGLTETRTQMTQKTGFAWQVFDRSSQPAVYLIHESVKKFLLNHDGLQMVSSMVKEEALRRGHYQVAESCANYLNTAELRRVVQTYPEPSVLGLTKSVELLRQLYHLYPFLHYSLHFVFEHVKAAVIGLHDADLLPTSLYQRMEEIFPVWRYFSDLDHKTCFHEPHGVEATLMHLAAENNMIRWVEYYLTHGGDVNVIGGRFGTLLQAASVMGYGEMVDLLLAFGADIHIDEGRFGTALSAAAWAGNLAIANILIQRGSDVNGTDGDYGNPLQAAACSPNGSKELIMALLGAGANINVDYGRHGTALQAGAYIGNEEIVRTLLENGADVNIACGEHGTTLGAAAFQGHERIAQILLENGADLTIEAGDYGNASWGAAYNGQKGTLHQIFQHRYPSWQHRKVETEVSIMMEKAAQTKRFHEAVEEGDLEFVKKSIVDGLDPNSRGGDFSSALHASAIYGHVEIVDYLLAQSTINLNLVDSRGRTPLWQAASNGHAEVTKMLLRTSKADCRCKSYSSGRNVLWFPASNGNVEIVSMLLDAGADPNEPDDDGQTPVQAAKEGSQSGVLKLFRNFGI